ncbi:MAG: nuclear transport factor 2 family protein [Dehalococcoidia bacterium]|nr:nuclear transport factor 2 family protein [Dehalococcoidia bacterium]
MTLSADDRLAILDLAARYNHAIDGGDASGWASTFTSDGIFVSREEVTGTDALVAFARNFAQNLPGARHWTNNHVIEGDGDAATHSCYLQLLNVAAEGGARVISTGTYRDQLTKVDGSWKFSRRHVVSDPRPA